MNSQLKDIQLLHHEISRRLIGRARCHLLTINPHALCGCRLVVQGKGYLPHPANAALMVNPCMPFSIGAALSD